MECNDCEGLLDDLRQGALPARREAEARSHLATCQRCRAKHMQGLRIAELTAARAAPLQRRSAWLRRMWRRLLPSPTPPRVGLLGRLPIVHQVATGSVMLLIVLAGLWSVPQLTRRHGAPHFDSTHAASSVDSTHPASNAKTQTPQPTAAEATPPTAAEIASLEPETPASDADGADDLAAGLHHYRAHEYAQATPRFSRALVAASTGAEQAMTLLYLARAERALGHCDRAVNSYATLVRVHAKKPEAQAALREGVACYDDLSEPSEAQHLLDQAASTPGLAADARRLIAQRGERIEKARRAGTSTRPPHKNHAH